MTKRNDLLDKEEFENLKNSLEKFKQREADKQARLEYYKKALKEMQ